MIHHFFKCAGISLGIIVGFAAALVILGLILQGMQELHDAIRRKWGEDGLAVLTVSTILAVIWALLFIICWVG